MKKNTENFRIAVSSINMQNIMGGIINSIEQAGCNKVDLLVLPEEPEIKMGQSGGKYTLYKHPIFVKVRQAIKKSKVGALAMSLSVKADGGVANVGFLMNSNGDIIGLYNKKHPAPGEEIITVPFGCDEPFPVFDFKGVKIALAICMDIHFPEMFRIYSLKGADIVCVPTMYRDYTGDMLESIEKARAIDNQMFLAVARYISLPYLSGKDMGYAKIISPDGRIIASTSHKPGIAVAKIDPKWRFPLWHDKEIVKQYKNFRGMFNKIRRPDLYGDLTQ